MKRYCVSLSVLALAAVVFAHVALAAPERRLLPAFPGAEGFGAYSVGGRGGKVYVVTTLKDYRPGKEDPIPGSLRAACAAEGPRIIVFAVSGIIELKDDLKVTNPYVTIAGQTAPGDGICLKNGSISVSGTHDVIVRYIRCRRGNESEKDGDSISVSKSQDVIFDHCSASWSIDETASFSSFGLKNVTVQWCMITESLNKSHHKKGAHGYGSILSSDNGGLTVHHTLYAHHNSRNPRMGGRPNQPGLLLDFRNNVIYDWGMRTAYTGEPQIRVNYINNYLKPGPSTNAKARYAFLANGPLNHMFLSGNVYEGWEDANKDNSLLVRFDDGTRKWTEADKKSVLVTEPYLMPEVKTNSATGAMEKVLASAGATLPKRDAVDARIAEEVRNGTGKIIDSQEEVGGWPAYKSEPAPLDTDQDGMSDEWEIKNGLNPKDASDASSDNDDDGYTAVEEYINNTKPQDEDNKTVLPPTITPADGAMFDKNATVTITPNASRCKIHYTTDGSEPTASSPLYANPFTIDKTTVVKAKVFKGELSSIRNYATISKIVYRKAENPAATEGGVYYVIYQNKANPAVSQMVASDPPLVTCSSKADTVDLAGIDPNGKHLVVFHGLINVPTDGLYTFHLKAGANNEAVFDVGGQRQIDTRTMEEEGSQESQTIAMKAGKHAFVVAFASRGQDPMLDLSWEGPGVTKQPLAGKWLARDKSFKLPPAGTPINNRAIERAAKRKAAASAPAKGTKS